MEYVRLSLVDIEVLNQQYVNDYDDSYVTLADIEIIYKYVPLSTSSIIPYYFSGQVSGGVTVSGIKVYAFDETTSNLVGNVSSTVSGTFFIPTNNSNNCYIVCLSNNIQYNHLIATKVIPINNT